MNERKRTLDILRGIGIFLMVFDHVGWGSFVHGYIQSFHMPLFFIASGYLWKNENTVNLIRKRFKTLMVPYFIFSGFYLLLQQITLFSTGNDFMSSLRAVLIYPTDIDCMPIAPALWFLPCMFFSSIVYSYLSKLKRQYKRNVVVGIAVIGMVYSSMSNIMLPFALEPLSVAIAFMLFGEIIRECENDVSKWIDRYWVIFILFITGALLAILNGSVDMRSARYHNCALYIINSIMGYLTYWGISKKIDANMIRIPRICVQKLTFFSRYAMGYICMNQLSIMLLDKLLKTFVADGLIFKIVSKVGVFTITMISIEYITKQIMNSKFKFILGRRS